ncbi:LPS assembly protein LptD [Lutimaribacter sp. EGI FJ00015]|uniref:LPS assembly protein LptD n=1 Tax=Lutimaribacter degradans TaxID=2945989 RepID=A0ACC5ZTE1_9RHOB|nr:LPS assembly protein LptD [Lutimaribacter sp. EGI FJ00013]MCM2561213.1 LPS assembly protein LptD [Lutimaribacter sp. EGI FJ00013]MCO0611838.1 LPS assembly protein LptD [Lutimaribacter sp. EGI FJ00015]MCO0635041.1 LPS assembly protein LptD [Lutimaribacter sp. EGI FJ00014]
MRGLWVALALLLATALPGVAQTRDGRNAAVLVADRVALEGDTRLVAEGNVEAIYRETRLKAARIVYDRSEDRLILDGPIMLIEGETTIILADSGALDADMRNGLLRGARMIMDKRVQLAANRIDRVGGRYTQLYKVAATSCRVCNSATPPIWEIRARRAVHDQQEKQFYFDNAQLRVLDVPILWLPRLRLPDATVERATGFLMPSLSSNSQLGAGVRVPYFIRIGNHRDLTITPFLAANSRTLELRYRQAFRNGDLEINGAFSNDELVADNRAYLFASGAFDLARGFKLQFDIEAVTDKAYLVDYDYSEKDRLDSTLALTRSRRDEYISAGITTYQTLRDGEVNAQIPTIIGDAMYERRYFPGRIGGELRMAYAVYGHRRYSDLDILGRDVARAEADLSWRRGWTLPKGLRLQFEGGVAVDTVRTWQDSTADSSKTQATPRAGLTLRWPLLRQAASGATVVLEPLVMIGWAGGSNSNLPNDESTRVEFDEGNLLSLSRFPAADRRERGLSAAYGFNWARFDPSGGQASLTMGHIVRDETQPDFTRTSGLDGLNSNLLLAGQYRTAGGIALTARTLFDTSFDLTKTEARAAWITPDLGLGASYFWLTEDLAEARPDPVSEWAFDGSYRISRHWTGTANWRYDVSNNRTAEAGLGLQYRNECVEVDLSLSRRFTSSTIVDPSTDLGITVGLRGFSAQGFDNSYTRTCRN